MSRPFIPAPKCASFELFYTFGSYVMENVLHTKSDIDYTDAMLQDVASRICTWDTNYARGIRGSGVNLVNIRCKALHASDAPLRDYIDAGNHAGSYGGSVLPPNATFCTSLRTGLAGRSARGRWYWVGLTTSHLASAYQISAVAGGTFTNYLNLLYGALWPSSGGHGHDWTIVSYMHDKAWREEAATYHVISILNTDLNVDSQRRRLAGRGRV